MSQIKDALTALRRTMSQAEIARAIGVNQSRISRWEAGDVASGAEAAAKLIALADMGELSRIAAVLFHDDADGETRANARLIAAAPDLLEIARAIVAICDIGKYADMACMEGSPLVDAARDAIAKAEGGAA